MTSRLYIYFKSQFFLCSPTKILMADWQDDDRFVKKADKIVVTIGWSRQLCPAWLSSTQRAAVGYKVVSLFNWGIE